MSESLTHVKLVKVLLEWIRGIEGNNENWTIFADSLSAHECSRPPTIEGFVPDVYALHALNGKVIIGEAKTAMDIESPRSRDQITAFIRFCQMNTNSLLVLAVPWHMTRFAKSLVNILRRKNQAQAVQTIFLEKLEG